MVIYGVSFDLVGKQPIVLLKTADGNRYLPIWIGQPEAAAILMKLQGASTPRPMTHDLFAEVLEQLEAQVVRITVTELKDNTFYASITVQQNGSEIEIDSRPSDAIALAVRAEAPIFAAASVIEESAIEFEGEEVNEEEIVSEFRKFLENVTARRVRASRTRKRPLSRDGWRWRRGPVARRRDFRSIRMGNAAARVPPSSSPLPVGVTPFRAVWLSAGSRPSRQRTNACPKDRSGDAVGI